MSRIGKKPIEISKGVDISIQNNTVDVKGPKGQLHWQYPTDMTVTKTGNEIVVTRSSDSKTHKALHGLTRMLIANMVEGVSNGFTKLLEIEGIGFSVELRGKSLFMNVGLSHPILFTPPEEITLSVPKNLNILISGINKQKVGQVAAKLRLICPPEPYKGFGIRYQGEHIRRKAGKKVGVK
ncbi:MAG: 50S ribosomal protein L6 [Candidatus Neomarinimicrobiota bacterium]